MTSWRRSRKSRREYVEKAREEIQDSADASTAEITARTNKIVEGESETRRKGLKRVDETLGATVSRVDGLQESIIRCRNEINGVKTMFGDFRKHYDDCVPKEEYRNGLTTTEKALESIRTRVKDLEVRIALKSDDAPATLRSTEEERQKAEVRRELDEVSSAIKAVSQKLRDVLNPPSYFGKILGSVQGHHFATRYRCTLAAPGKQVQACLSWIGDGSRSKHQARLLGAPRGKIHGILS